MRKQEACHRQIRHLYYYGGENFLDIEAGRKSFESQGHSTMVTELKELLLGCRCLNRGAI